MVVSSSVLVTLMMEVLHSFETSVLTRAIQRNIPEDGILHKNCIFIIKDNSARNKLMLEIADCGMIE
jgi:hypothetical protein